MASPKCKPPIPKGRKGFSKVFTHWRTGVKYYAEDYGYDAWPIGGSRK